VRVLVAGATSVLGKPVLSELVARGHEPVALSRSDRSREAFEREGRRAAAADVLDADSLSRVLAEQRPEAVISLLIALPKRGPMRVADFRRTVRLWKEGVPNLIAASAEAGARRFLAESVVFAYGYGRFDSRLDESHPATGGAVLKGHGEVLGALRQMERQAIGGGMEGLVLRYGLFHGRDVPSTRFMLRSLRWRLPLVPGEGAGVLSWIEPRDAATATVQALERGKGGEIYNVVDDEPVVFRDYARALADAGNAPRPRSLPKWLAWRALPHVATMLDHSRLPISNAKAKRELGWAPRFPTYREVLADVGESRR
jgi:nucleoside-diphosphate-sugar epimerase